MLYRLPQCRLPEQQGSLVHRKLHRGRGHVVPGPPRVQQEEGVQLDGGLQLDHRPPALRHPRRVRRGQVLPRPLAGGHRQALQLRRPRGLDPGGRGPRGHRLHRARGRVALHLVLIALFHSVRTNPIVI